MGDRRLLGARLDGDAGVDHGVGRAPVDDASDPALLRPVDLEDEQLVAVRVGRRRGGRAGDVRVGVDAAVVV